MRVGKDADFGAAILNNDKCIVLVPVITAAEPVTDALLDVLKSRGYVVRKLWGSSQVDLARSTLAAQAFKEGFEETFWIDADQVFNPDDVDHIRALDLPFVAGMYPCKGPKRMAGKLKSNAKVIFGAGGSVVEVELVGMGFTYVHCEVYAAILQQGHTKLCGGGYDGTTLYPFFLPLLEKMTADATMSTYLSEDYSFCIRAKRAGYPPMVDTRVKVGHIGKKTYTWDDMLPDTVLASVDVEQKESTGEIVAVSATSIMFQQGTAMGITKEELTAELATLDQQEAQCRDTIASADRVKADAQTRLEAVNGAKQMAQHLLKKIETKETPATVEQLTPADLNNKEQTDGDQS